MNLSVSLHCGDSLFQTNFTNWLAEEGLRVCNEATYKLLVDRPLGWAILEHPNISYKECLVLSDNSCPTYRLDLMERGPAALIHLTDGDAIMPTLKLIQKGSVISPKVTTPLTLAERKTLRWVALGRTNKEIANKRGVTERTVKNSLSEIYRKLNLKSRVQASHYYLGNWHLIEGWEKPSFLT